MARLIDAECIWDHSICYDIECDKCSFADGEKCKLRQRIQNVRSVDAEPVNHGHWVTKKTATGATYTVCSHCSTSVKYNDEYGTVVMNLKGANYCPNCGAKMDGGSE